MPSCPQCETELTDDFGIVDCKACGAVCSVDLDGNVQLQGVDAAPVEEESAPVEEIVEEAYEAAEVDTYEEELPAEKEAVESYEATEESAPETIEENDDYSSYEATAEEVEALEEQAVETDLFEDPVEEVVASIAAPMAGKDFLKDLEVFSEEASADGVGHTYYDLHISGFDSKTDKDILIETLADSRLEIDEQALVELIGENSECTLYQITFLRLSVIYKRLSGLGVEMSWVLSEEQQPLAPEYSDDEYAEAEVDESY